MSLEVGTCFRNLANEGQNFPTKIICMCENDITQFEKKMQKFRPKPRKYLAIFLKHWSNYGY
jgi:hypothetical protein